ncbi:MAG: hypothetical protein IKT82_02090 [Bacteroidaceae bacterium]|nr:hypothetical protein [Bacteroidaceae bacterium]
MSKIINGIEYYIPDNLTLEQENIYCHIIDWKRKHVTEERGVFRGHEYDAILPKVSSIPLMIYDPIIPILQEMQLGEFAYKPHIYAHHAVSSQTACINLFMPLLLSKDINSILPNISGCPIGFKEIAKDKLFNGFCFEYWGQDIKKGKGLLNDHTLQAGTDADVAIAYRDTNGNLCLWLIEHKLSEKEFTTCGGYKSEANKQKNNCEECDFANISSHPETCYYHQIQYKYWDILKQRISKYNGNLLEIKGCPFKLGMNQLWRNQMLAFALENTGIYHTVTFSVCHHAKNTMLMHTINQYKTFINNEQLFTSFTNYDILNVVTESHISLNDWKKWYKDVYYF